MGTKQYSRYCIFVCSAFSSILENGWILFSDCICQCRMAISAGSNEFSLNEKTNQFSPTYCTFHVIPPCQVESIFNSMPTAVYFWIEAISIVLWSVYVLCQVNRYGISNKYIKTKSCHYNQNPTKQKFTRSQSQKHFLHSFLFQKKNYIACSFSLDAIFQQHPGQIPLNLFAIFIPIALDINPAKHRTHLDVQSKTFTNYFLLWSLISPFLDVWM